MTKSKTNPQVDEFVRNAQNWQKELKRLRKILLGCHLIESLKWNKPCYSLETGNVVILLPLKNYCALLFCKGALLKDPQGILVKAGENTQAARQIRFTSLREIGGMESTLKAYLHNAIDVEKAGLEVTYKKTAEFKVPEELQKKLDKSPALKTAFDALTPGRQRGYLLYFSAPKQSKTRKSRIEKCAPRILSGKGLNDR